MNSSPQDLFKFEVFFENSKSNKASLFLNKYDEYVEFNEDWSENTKQDYKSIRKKFEAFEEYKKYKYRTTELDLNYFKEFRNWTKSHNIAKNTFGGYIAKLRAVIKHFRRVDGDTFRYHSHIELFKTYKEQVDHEILDKNELELIWNYQGKSIFRERKRYFKASLLYVFALERV